jgi:hypothetical protein
VGIHREAPDEYGAAGWRPGWLPPGGRGNGLDGVAASWTELVDVENPHVTPVLQALLIAEIPAYAAPRPGPIRRRLAPRAPDVWRVWVEVWTHATAEDVIRRELPYLRRRG